MTARLVFDCPHCGKECAISLVDAHKAKRGGDSAASLGPAPLPSGGPTLSGRASDMCACGHERGWHTIAHVEGDGPMRHACAYGSTSPHGRCTCEGFHSRRRGVGRRDAKPANGAPPAAKGSEGPCAEALIGVLVQRTRAGVETTREQLAVLSGYSASSSTFDASLARLRRTGFAEGSPHALRAQGSALQLRTVAPLPAGAELLELWASKLDKAPATLLRALAGARSYQATRAELAEVADYSTTSSTFDAALATIRRLHLVDRPTKELYRLRPELRHEAAS